MYSTNVPRLLRFLLLLVTVAAISLTHTTQAQQD